LPLQGPGDKTDAKEHDEVGSAPKVPQDPLHSDEMWLPRGVHMKAHLLDDIGDVRMGEDEVLQRPSKTPVAGGISYQGDVVRAGLAPYRAYNQPCQHARGCRRCTGDGGETSPRTSAPR
jgi:hypothetical protein